MLVIGKNYQSALRLDSCNEFKDVWNNDMEKQVWFQFFNKTQVEFNSLIG